MQRNTAFFPLNGLYFLALTLALPACDEPVEDEASLAADDEEAAGERTGQVQLEDGTELTYEVRNGQAIVNGDILLGDAEEIETRFRAAGSTTHAWGGAWPGGVVYFQIQPGFWQNNLVPAIQHWEAKTGIQFVNYAHPNGYVLFGNFYGGCSAHVGRHTNAITVISMAPGCDDFKVWVHEIGHTVGLHHEQSRTDRDWHVNINWQNISGSQHHNFQTYAQQGYTGHNLGAYDHSSIMQYDSWAFSYAPGNWNAMTITHKNGAPINHAPYGGLSPGDVQGVGMMYGIW